MQHHFSLCINLESDAFLYVLILFNLESNVFLYVLILFNLESDAFLYVLTLFNLESDAFLYVLILFNLDADAFPLKDISLLPSPPLPPPLTQTHMSCTLYWTFSVVQEGRLNKTAVVMHYVNKDMLSKQHFMQSWYFYYCQGNWFRMTNNNSLMSWLIIYWLSTE